MGLQWDGGVPDVEFWKAIHCTTKPGGYMLACGGTRTFHRLTCAIEDAGWEVRDVVCWLYGQGFPKGQGCLKPAWEPIILARKPGRRVLPLGIDECRIPGQPEPSRFDPAKHSHDGWRMNATGTECAARAAEAGGRYPANVCLDEETAADLDGQVGTLTSGTIDGEYNRKDRQNYRMPGATTCYADSGGPSRYFYVAKADKAERGKGNSHPTVKPLSLMLWLVRLITPPDGVILDPFAGSGTTGVAARHLNRRFVGVELSEEYATIARRRIAEAAPLSDAAVKAAAVPAAEPTLFDALEASP